MSHQSPGSWKPRNNLNKSKSGSENGTANESKYNIKRNKIDKRQKLIIIKRKQLGMKKSKHSGLLAENLLIIIYYFTRP